MPIICHKKIKKDYQSKNLKNPFFRKKEKEKKPGVWRWWIIIILFSFILIAWLIFIAPFWNIKKIQINGLTRLPNNELENIIFEQVKAKHGWIFSESNIFVFKKSSAADKIIANYNFSNIEIHKKLPNTLIINVQERPYSFIFQEGSGLFYASADAYVIKDQVVSEEDKKKYFILENKTSNSLINEKYKININNSYLNFAIKLNSALSARHELSIEKSIIDQEYNTIKVKIANGPLIYFNVNDDIEKQIEYLLLVKKEKIGDNFSRTNYIDLRYGEKIFINPDFNQNKTN